PAADELTSRQLRNVLALLLLRSGQEDVVRAKGSVRRHDDAHRAIYARKFLDGGGVLDIAHSRAAVLRGEDDAQQAQASQFLHGLQREARGLVPLHYMGRNFAFRELAYALL